MTFLLLVDRNCMRLCQGWARSLHGYNLLILNASILCPLRGNRLLEGWLFCGGLTMRWWMCIEFFCCRWRLSLWVVECGYWSILLVWLKDRSRLNAHIFAGLALSVLIERHVLLHDQTMRIILGFNCAWLIAISHLTWRANFIGLGLLQWLLKKVVLHWLLAMSCRRLLTRETLLI